MPTTCGIATIVVPSSTAWEAPYYSCYMVKYNFPQRVHTHGRNRWDPSTTTTIRAVLLIHVEGGLRAMSFRSTEEGALDKIVTHRGSHPPRTSPNFTGEPKLSLQFSLGLIFWEGCTGFLITIAILTNLSGDRPRYPLSPRVEVAGKCRSLPENRLFSVRC